MQYFICFHPFGAPQNYLNFAKRQRTATEC